jgi:hypothetical protein
MYETVNTAVIAPTVFGMDGLNGGYAVSRGHLP